eukprot:TRINITY_DN21666_c0_g1_i1.p1 TRINITY_DN21666_c0_g1~~TRINITY_DN21666_c0_g1_i1.p1  ORF type:complete len:287 (+),score=96.38 TRINITY_DN21666_c0_g1_i1:91-951(+)
MADRQPLGNKFAAAKVSLDKRLAEATVGLVTKEEFASKRKDLEERGDRSDVKRARKKKKSKDKTLSFGNDEDEEEGGDEGATVVEVKRYGEEQQQRDKEEELRRRAIESEYEGERARQMAEPVTVAYNVYPERKRYTAKVTKGTTIAHFVQQCIRDNKELKSVNDALFVKEDLILPLDSRFYDYFTVAASGRSGKLCEFERVLEDGGRRKTTAIVCAKWYSLNKELSPAKDWEYFDFSKNYRKDWRSGQTGDWNCSECKTLNWGSKNPTKCMRCGAARPTFSMPLV